MPPFKKIVETLMKRAKEKGAKSVKLIPTRDVFAEDFVRQKCRYGCEDYAKSFTCPPYAPTPDETRKILKSYKQGLLLEFSRVRNKKDQPNVREIMYELEREAFLNGLYRAFAYTAGPCKICEICPAVKIENPNEFSKIKCVNPSKARPSMEACGINVYKTVRKAGFKLDVVTGGECYKCFSLLLLK